MWLINKLMVGCDRASFLISKKETKSLSFIESVQLKLHILACKMCRHFEEQSHFINEKVSDSIKNPSDKKLSNTLSEAKKKSLKKILKQ
jgi:hypothetical protein